MPSTSVLGDENLQWYLQNKELYSACATTMHQLIDTILAHSSIPVHSIQHRLKEQDSFLEKCDNPKYTDPVNQITDLCGLRIITYTNKDVERICQVIEQEFTVDRPNSINKAEQMDTNEVGYLSVHYIVTLNPTRKQLPEYKPYSNIRFEIQVRTLLQHAWAEIEHDRSYKFSGELPKEIKRRFYLVAGTLELMDREFDHLSDEIDLYADDIKEKTSKGNLDVLIDSTSLIEYLNMKLAAVTVRQRSLMGYDKEIIRELNSFGINTLADLDRVMSDNLISQFDWELVNYVGTLRAVMMTTDPSRYFETVWDKSWIGMDEESFHNFVRINPDIKKYKRLLLIR